LKGCDRMNLNHLRYFVALAKLEHYTLAAEKLMITQPSLTHAITQMESELGIKLFERNGRNSVLTKCGKDFLRDVELSLSCLDKGIDRMKYTASGEGKVDFAFLRSLGSDLAPVFIGGYMKNNPEKHIKFNCFPGMTTDLLKGLKERKYDMVLCSKPPSVKFRDISFTNISRQELVIITPPNNPLAEMTEVGLREAASYPFVAYSEKTALRTIIDGLFYRQAKEPNIAYEVEDDISVAGFVSHGLGIAIVPNLPILREFDVRVKKIKNTFPVWGRSFDIAVLKDVQLTPAAQSFMNYIIEQSGISGQC